MEKEITILLNQCPFYANVIQRCQIGYSDIVPTAGVRIGNQGVVEFMINKTFFESLPVDHRVGVLIHEVLHLVNNHLVRLRTLNPKISNLAADIAINQYIPGHMLPEGCFLPDRLHFLTQLLPPGFTLPPQDSAERYYNMLMKELRDKLDQLPGNAQKKSGPCEKCEGDSSEKGPEDGEGEGSGTLEPQGGSQCGSGEPSGKPGKPCTCKPSQGSPGPQGTLDDHNFWATGVTDREEVDQIMQDTLIRAVQDTERRHGTGSIPIQVRKMIDDALKPAKVDWRRQFKNIVGRALSTELSSTRKRANRRLGLKAAGTKTATFPKILVALDESGSVSDQDRHLLLQELKEILKLSQDKVQVITFDTKIGKTKWSLKNLNKLPPRQLAGGTDFQPVIDYANSVKPDLLVVLTDGEAPIPEMPRCKLMWVITGRDNPSLPGIRIVLPGDRNSQKVA